MAGTSFFALIDDIISILDDVAALTKIATKKTVGVVGDDLALNAKQVVGIRAEREFPVIWAVTKGSLLNKLIIVPIALLISYIAPFLIQPLLMIGGAYLCFEGAEKILHNLKHPRSNYNLDDQLKTAAEASAIIEDSLKADQDFRKHENLKIKAFGSTDIGGSFLICFDDQVIFHAGDLNNWHWNEESPTQESREYEENFLNELGLLYADAPNLDLALFPIDPRLGKDYMRGAEQFLDKIQTKVFAPMHFHDAYDKVRAFDEYATSKGCKLFSPSKRGESINL